MAGTNFKEELTEIDSDEGGQMKVFVQRRIRHEYVPRALQGLPLGIRIVIQ